MKLSNIAIVLLIVALSIFTYLYFANPRIVTNTIVEKIPTRIDVDFGPAAPDTVFMVALTEDEAEDWGIEDDWETVEAPVVASRKTFHRSLLLMDVTSEVTAYAPEEVYAIENKITLEPNRKAIAEELNSTIRKECRRSLWKGLYIGAGASAVLITTVVLLAR